MSFKPFYVHINHGPGPLPSRWARGATVLVSPDPQDGRSCVVQVAVCSRKDQFNKKIGRGTAELAEEHVINKRQLGHKMVDLYVLTAPTRQPYPKGFDYLYKYML